MKVSYTWLNHHLHSHAEKHGGETYSLPHPEKVAELLIFNAFEVESVEKVGDDYVLDVKITPNRAHDCLSHKGIAREVARLLGKPIYPEKFIDYSVTSDKEVFIEIAEPKLCPRYMGVVIENITVKESPEWLKKRLETLGQRSINNVVDATNFVMLEIGQPLHAFDLDNISTDTAGNPHIIVRNAVAGERLATLDEKELALDDGLLIIADEKKPLALAGVKGGKVAEINGHTTSIMIESANFNPTQVRIASQKSGIRTDSSYRFEHGLSPVLAEEGMRLAIEMILELAKNPDTKIGEISDAYPRKRNDYWLGVSVSEVNKVLGTNLKEKDIEKILKQLHFPFEIINPIKRVFELAPKFVGVPYKLGASISYDAPSSFDCASFVAYIYAHTGIGLPRISVDQYVYSERIERGEIKTGDLVFSNNESNDVMKYKSVEFLPGTPVEGGVSHVGIVLDNGKIIHASSTKGQVIIEELKNSDRFKNITGYGRVIFDKEERFAVTVPKERLDLMATRSFLVSGIKEDLIEEIGRIYGYRNIKATKPAKSTKKLINDEKFDKANKIRESLVKEGFSEVMTYTFVNKGEIELKNPIAEDKKFLRDNLINGLDTSIISTIIHNAPLLGLNKIKIFEIGTVFKKNSEEIYVAVRESKDLKISPILSRSRIVEVRGLTGNEYTLDKAYNEFVKSDSGSSETTESKLIRYKPISQYPFALRDIAVFVPSGTDESAVKKIIEKEAGDLLVRTDLFDRFEKDGKISYAFHLVFQSYEKTLSEDELNKIMERITAMLNKQKGWEVR